MKAGEVLNDAVHAVGERPGKNALARKLIALSADVAELLTACKERDEADAAINGARDINAACLRLRRAKERYQAALAKFD